eukprot:scaffold8374_cov29-Prasinocladus_malaysianus.AAC.1
MVKKEGKGVQCIHCGHGAPGGRQRTGEMIPGEIPVLEHTPPIKGTFLATATSSRKTYIQTGTKVGCTHSASINDMVLHAAGRLPVSLLFCDDLMVGMYIGKT